MAPVKKAKAKKPLRPIRSMKSPLLVKPKAKKFSSTAIRKANKTRKRSSIELLVYKWLNEEGIVFKKEKVIGRCHVDIFIEPNKVLEVNGCYWHRSICCFPEKTKENLEIRMRDVKRYAFFRNKGYEVHSIRECDIKNDPDKVREYIKTVARGY